MVAGHSLAGQRGGAGYPQEMQEHTALGRFEVIRLDLAGHIHGDEALQSQHHLRQIAVNVVDDLQPQTFFSSSAMPNIHFLGNSGSWAISVMGILLYKTPALWSATAPPPS